MWRFLVDEAMPRSTVGALRNAGYEAEDVRDVGLRSAVDRRVYEYAQSHNAILVTEDMDFSNVLDYPLETHHGIVVLRVPQDYSAQQKNRTLLNALKELEEQSLKSALVIVTTDRVRIRRE